MDLHAVGRCELDVAMNELLLSRTFQHLPVGIEEETTAADSHQENQNGEGAEQYRSHVHKMFCTETKPT